jgi:hypothetical protein
MPLFAVCVCLYPEAWELPTKRLPVFDHEDAASGERRAGLLRRSVANPDYHYYETTIAERLVFWLK